jgi:hypothetical protein
MGEQLQPEQPWHQRNARLLSWLASVLLPALAAVLCPLLPTPGNQICHVSSVLISKAAQPAPSAPLSFGAADAGF